MGCLLTAPILFTWLSVETDDQLNTLESVIKNIPLCQLLMSASQGGDKVIIKAYIHDLICSKYKLQSEEGYDVSETFGGICCLLLQNSSYALLIMADHGYHILEFHLPW